MIPAHLRNPFLISKLEETFQIPPGNVPELHAGTLAACEQVVRQIKGATPQHDTSFGLLVVGEAGSGKSHLLAQLRSHLQGSEDVVLAAIAMRGAFAGRLWRHLRENLVTELLRDFSSGQTTTNGLARLLRNRFSQLATSNPQPNPPRGLIERIFGDPQSPQKLSNCLQELAVKENLDNGLIRVLPALDRPELRMLARDWLLGRQLTDEEQQRLNLPVSHPSEIEQEVQSRNLVRSLLRLAGRETRLVLCFDEVEAIQAGSYDDTVLCQFTTLVTDVLALPGPRAVITCVRPVLRLQIEKLEKSTFQKLAQRQSNIPTLTWEQSVQIVLARLQADPQIAELRQRQATYWPFGEEYLRRTWEKYRFGLTPRHLINHCAEEFNRLQAQPGEDGRKSRDSVFARIWERNRQRFLERPASLQFDAMLGLVIPWLVNVHQLPLQRRSAHSDLLGDINLLFAFRERRALPIGISFCNHEPSYFWRRLDRLIKQWESQRGRLLGKLLLLLRSSHMRITPGALQRLERLQALGVQVHFLESQQLAELAAFQAMMTAALEGDLTHEGSPVDSHDYDAWVCSNTSDAVKEFLDTLFPDLHTVQQAANPVLSQVEVGK